MYCKYCGSENRKKAKYCINCNRKLKSKKYLIASLLTLAFFICASFFVYLTIDKIFTEDSNKNVTIKKEKTDKNKEVKKDLKEPVENIKTEIDKNKKTKIINAASETVYTVFSEDLQGSGFLYNKSGIIITNAHVVEGSIDVIVKNNLGIEMPGKVIGYSNETDVAIVQVNELFGEQPYPLELEKPIEIGERVIAIGSPLGLENTATVGYLTGVDRHLTIGTFVYENIYQITAPIEPGNSGGALVSVENQKIIAINSAKSTETDSIGFSIPLYNVKPLIEEWILSPMQESDVLNEFYDADGVPYFGDDYSTDEGNFDGDDYVEEYEDNLYWYYNGENWYEENRFDESDYDNYDEEVAQ